MSMVKDSVEAALDLDEKSVYSHIAHESAEDIIRIISSIDAERARLRGEVIYYTDDWDDLIRQRIAKGKRHTAFDFYNPALLDIWEAKVKKVKALKNAEKIAYTLYAFVIALSIGLLFLAGSLIILPVLSIAPLVLFLRGWIRDRMDLSYYELTQFFIDEMAELVRRHGLRPENYRFKLFGNDYFGVKAFNQRSSTFVVEVEGND
ncbi:hypothetical protein [Thermococcus peptonophilus]|uniref:Uncharacterized protein n=1 Tax=Thermococcus peptonophilus TaxID=53952 RepID=A0A142CVW2_9EURY|nr:hypothetical protein [Thermococcus peptonophilus]AMQ18914.1 hypothetical protein A0127_06890 [Thermococcus peptonophilus]